MRMWMVDPKIMCRKHLLGEHVECHMLLGAILKGKSINGYIEKDLLEPRSLIQRHNILAQEMVRRNYNHKSFMYSCDKNLVLFYLDNHIINKEKSLQDLLNRCSECKSRYNQKF